MTTGTDTRPPRSAHVEAARAGTRERLVRAAREAIEEGGYGAAPVAAIAQRAGLAAGTLYRHFPSKAELFLEVFRAVSRREIEAMRQAAAEAGGPQEQLDAVIRTYAGRALASPRLAWALVYEPVDPLVDAERLEYRREYRNGMAAILRAGIDAGELPDQDAELSAAAVVGVICEALVGPLSPVAGTTAPREQTVAAIVSLCRRTVGASDLETAERPDATKEAR